jgi:diguanylate cyclase (GGDEF)-like protein
VDSRDPRQYVARILEDRSRTILQDAVTLLPFAGLQKTDVDACMRLGEIVLQVLIAATREGWIDPAGRQIAALRRLACEKSLAVTQLFELAYIIERTALDELALDESFGAVSVPWPVVAQAARRASFASLAGFAERLAHEAGESAVIDSLTTLHSRAVLMIAIDKEIHRAERAREPFALILFDVDQLGHINAKRGFDFGDRVLERLGIVLRTYFREQDWVCRESADKFGVLLPDTAQEHADLLAERVRATVQDRMALRDYRTDEKVAVTVSAGVVIAEAVDKRLRAQHLLRAADAAVHRAKDAGRNRIERVSFTLPQAVNE